MNCGRRVWCGTFASGQEIALAAGMRCRPLPIRHDSGATFGFRLEGTPDLFGNAASLGYVADLGTWDMTLAEGLANVDLLAVEFNHDVAMQYASGRSPALIARVLGDQRPSVECAGRRFRLCGVTAFRGRTVTASRTTAPEPRLQSANLSKRDGTRGLGPVASGRDGSHRDAGRTAADRGAG